MAGRCTGRHHADPLPGKKLAAGGEAPSFTEKKPRLEDVELTAVPYGSWCNKKPGEMIVWVHSLPG
jgi:DUF1680 family protein